MHGAAAVVARRDGLQPSRVNAVNLCVDGNEIDAARAVELLERSGRLAAVLGWILRQHVLERELARIAAEEDVTSALAASAVTAFQAGAGLPGDAALGEWLAGRGRSRAEFDRDVARRVRIEQLKHEVTRADLAEHFERRRMFLDCAVVTAFSLESKPAADDAVANLRASRPVERVENWVATVSWAELTRDLDDAPAAPTPGFVFGPVQLGTRFAVFRVNEVVSASLEDADVRRRVRDELFELWLAERLEQLDVSLVRT